MRKLLLCIGIALAAIGCTKYADVTQSGDNALTITSNITTRVADGNWEEDDPIGVYMTTETLGDEGANAEYTTADGDGAFTSASPLYLPSSGEGVSIFAYYPYVADVDLAAYSIKSEEQVDLLSAKADDVTSSAVALTFNHLLSKVSLTIKAGDGLEDTDLGDLTVELSGIYTTATFDLTQDKATTTGSTTELELTTSEDGTSSSAIVIPQALSKAEILFTTENYGTFSATLATEEFKTGMEYSYTATINRTGVEITSANIDTWDAEGLEEGTASIADIEYKSDGIYYINSAKGLAAFSDLVYGAGSNTKGATFAGFESTAFESSNTEINGVLTRNIDLSDICGADVGEDGASVSWVPIGRATDTAFAGEFDGGGYKVSGLYIGTGSKLGLFGYLDEKGLVYNVGVEGTITTTSSEVAGIVAWNKGWVMNSYSEIAVTGGANTAGIVGYNQGNVVNCYNKGDVKGTNNVGGIVGQNVTGGYVGYCYSVGEIDGSLRYGGVVGWNHSTTAEAPTIKGSFCLSNTNYSIGQLESAASSGSYSGNMYDEEYLTSDIFATLMNNGTYTYNTNLDDLGNPVHTESPVPACAWNDNSASSDYPTLNVLGKITEKNEDVYDIIYNSGTYEIYTANGLKAFANLVNNGGIEEGDFVTSGNFTNYFAVISSRTSISGKLMDDIDLGGTSDAQWTAIGSSSNKFTGTFEGGGFKVSGIYIDNSSEYQGLFGYLGSDGTIKNLGVAGTIDGYKSVGGVVGSSFGSVTNCYNTATVSGDSEVGGVVGYSSGSVTNCYNTATVSGNDKVGGVVGFYISGSVTNCYNTATVSGSSQVGGVVGRSYGSVTNCYNAAEVSGTGDYVGGVVGMYDRSVTSCYYLEKGDLIGVGNVATDVDANTLKMTDAEMKEEAFVTTLNSNAYYYNSTLSTGATTACAWAVVTNGYPTLSFGADPGTTYSTLSNFNDDSDYLPVGDVWYITDYQAEKVDDFAGLKAALQAADNGRNDKDITVIFSNLPDLFASVFENCTYLTSISLPSATYIESSAFANCGKLASVSLPSATDIKTSAFYGCGALTSLSLPSATKIGECAFNDCTSLTELDLGSSGSGITSIGLDAFSGTTTTSSIDLTIKIASGVTGVSVGEDGKTLTYNSGNSTAVFKSITEIANWSLND